MPLAAHQSIGGLRHGRCAAHARTQNVYLSSWIEMKPLPSLSNTLNASTMSSSVSLDLILSAMSSANLSKEISLVPLGSADCLGCENDRR